MERAERLDDPVEAQRLAAEGQQAQIWTALPGLVTAFDPAAMTVSIQPAVAGSIRGEGGKATSCQMPLLVDVPVVFPCGGGFTLTHPIRAGDEALVVFSSRCIDGWWQQGQAAPPPDGRMHDLSDGMAIVGMRSQARKLDPPVDTENVQLRSDDGKTTVTMTPQGEIRLECEKEIKIKAPSIVLEGNVTTTGAGGGSGKISMKGDLALEGGMAATRDITAEGKSVAHHTHEGTGEPR